jgi:hypothetical protein
MKIITELGLNKLEEELKCSIFTDRFSKEFSLLFEDIVKLSSAKKVLTEKQIPYHIGLRNTLELKLESLYSLLGDEFFEEVRVWNTPKNKLVTPTSTMDHQRLSNCVHLLELFLETGRLSVDEGNDYLGKLTDAIIPEIEERFSGDLLPYKPFFSWELSLLQEVEEKRKLSIDNHP